MSSETGEPIGALGAWFAGSRPRTLTMAAVPVAVGAALAWSDGAGIDTLTLAVTLACAMLIQIGTNLLNDAHDGLRGADGPDRLGPTRLTGSGRRSGREVKRAAVASFGLAVAAGAWLVFVGGWPILAIGITSVAAGYAYSSGRRPLSYGPWGEIYVIVFFGIVAVAGSYLLQAHRMPGLAVALSGIAIGCPAAAVLLVNNLRDLEQDRRAGRRTLALRLGATAARWLYAALLLAPFPLLVAALGWRHAMLPALALPAALWLALRFAAMPAGLAMNSQLGRTTLLQLLLGTLMVVAVLR